MTFGPQRTRTARTPFARRLPSILVVALLHAVIVMGLLIATKLPQGIKRPREIILTLLQIPSAQPEQPNPAKNKPGKNKRKPQTRHAITRGIYIPTDRYLRIQPDAKTHQGVKLSIDCISHPELLTPDERAKCASPRTQQAGKEERTLILGPLAPSIWAEQFLERKKGIKPIEGPCPVGNPTANLGTPCIDLTGNHEIGDLLRGKPP